MTQCNEPMKDQDGYMLSWRGKYVTCTDETTEGEHGDEEHHAKMRQGDITAHFYWPVKKKEQFFELEYGLPGTYSVVKKFPDTEEGKQDLKLTVLNKLDTYNTVTFSCRKVTR